MVYFKSAIYLSVMFIILLRLIITHFRLFTPNHSNPSIDGEIKNSIKNKNFIPQFDMLRCDDLESFILMNRQESSVTEL